MKKKSYKRRCGDFEIRVLTDGQIIMLAPDDELMAIARGLDLKSEGLPPEATKRHKKLKRSKNKSHLNLSIF